jgi:hypothetical protein
MPYVASFARAVRPQVPRSVALPKWTKGGVVSSYDAWTAPVTQVSTSTPQADKVAAKVNASSNQQTATDIIKSSGELSPVAANINYGYIVVGAAALTLASFAVYKLSRSKRR